MRSFKWKRWLKHFDPIQSRSVFLWIIPVSLSSILDTFQESSDRVYKWHSTIKTKESCSQNSSFPHVIKSSVPEEETKECVGPSHMCLWERSDEKRPAAQRNRDRRKEHKSALWASKWWMAKCQSRAIHTIEFTLLRLLKVILLLIFCGRCSYSFLTETLDFHLLDT